jgi:hypothetical protein
VSRHETAPRHGLAPSKRHDVATDVRLIREEAEKRLNETDLLVAALRDHVRDLQAERDRLRAELEAMREGEQLQAAAWLWRGTKAPRE